jgi:phenylalanyl-tRNA synthetase beta chain
MHAFDLDALEGREVRIRRAAPGEKLTTLDGVERPLEPGMLVIADARRAQAVAGVMGGRRSEVMPGTRVVAFESAYFDPRSVRRTGKRLGLKTEASARFERGTDIAAPPIAMARALDLIERIGAGRRAGGAIDEFPRPRQPRTITLRRTRLAELIGLSVPDEEVARILEGLGLLAAPAASGWNVVVPTFRVDLLREVDLIEEVARHHGFDKIEPTFPAMIEASPPPDPRIPRDQLVRRLLSAAGLTEAVTFGFVDTGAAAPFADTDGRKPVPIANPLSAKFEVLRPLVVASLVDALAHNRRHGRRDVALFEIGSRFSAPVGETRAVAIAWTGLPTPEHWSGGTREVDFFDAKGVIERLCAGMGVSARFEPADASFLVSGESALVIVDGNIEAGRVGRLQPTVLDARGAPPHDRVYVAELELDRLSPARGRPSEHVEPLPRYPFVVRDLSIIVDESLPAAIIRGTIQAAAESSAAPLVAIAFFDRYRGKGVPAGSVSLSIRLTFQARDRTLVDVEVQEGFDRIVSALAAAHGARQR